MIAPLPVENPADLLPRPDAIDTSTQVELKAQWIAKFTALFPAYDVAMLRSDPGGINADAMAFLRLDDRKHLNDVFRAGLLALAKGSNLDAVAADFGLERLVYAPATGTTPAVVEDDDAFLVRAWTTMQRWARGSSNLGLEGAAWPLALPDATDIRVDDFPGEGRMRCVLLPRPSLDAAGRAALVSRVSTGLMRRDRRPGSVWLDVVPAEVITLDLAITLGVLPGASQEAAKAAAGAAVARYLAKTRRIDTRVALSRVEGDACVTNVVYAHVAGMAGDLLPTGGQAYQLGTLTMLAERARG